MIEVKLGDLLEAQKSIEKLMKIEQIPAHLAYRLAQIYRELQPELVEYHRQRDGLVAKYGEQEKGQDGQYRIPPESVPVFLAEHDALCEERIKIEREPFRLEEIGQLAGLSGEDMLALDFLIQG